MRCRLLIGMFCAAIVLPCRAADSGLLGDWREPGGSVIRIAFCGQELCATLVTIRPDAPTKFDIKNPDASQQGHKLCGLMIGKSFHASDQAHADGGTLYDPKSGKTYRGTMTAEGNQLFLRGYVGIKLFGRTETWIRTQAPSACGA